MAFKKPSASKPPKLKGGAHSGIGRLQKAGKPLPKGCK